MCTGTTQSICEVRKGVAGGRGGGGTLQAMSQKLHLIGWVSKTASVIGPQLSKILGKILA